MDKKNERSCDHNNSLSFNLNLHPSAQTSSDHLFNEGGELRELISSMYKENRKMREMVGDMFDKYLELHNQLTQFISDGHDHHSRKRKAEEDADDRILPAELGCFADGNCCRRQRMINTCKAKINTVFVRVDRSDTTLIVKDGYQWRKYGQKVTRDNPSPRAYYKCSFAPLCAVKKKVQKSVEDPTILVATYEGEHNHKQPSKLPTLKPSNIITTTSSTNLGTIPSPTSLDGLIRQTLSGCSHKDKGNDTDDADAEQLRIPLQDWLVDRLTKDPSFTSSLAAAISDKLLQQTF